MTPREMPLQEAERNRCETERSAVTAKGWPEGRAQRVRGTSGMDAARGVRGHGWPLAPCPRSDDAAREVWRSQTRMQGQALLVTFLAFEKSDSPGRAKQKLTAHSVMNRTCDPKSLTSDCQSGITPSGTPFQPYQPH